MKTERRSFLAATAVGLGGALLGVNLVSASEDSKKGGKSLDHALLKELTRTASDCVRTGEACAAHCERELAGGNASMGKCDRKTHEMLALTRAMLSLAISGSSYAAELAPLCAEACKSCAEACAEHREHFAHGMHLECKECMEACQACEKACRKVA